MVNYIFVGRLKKTTHRILKEMYLSGTNPSLPLNDPIHQSVDTCFLSSTASPFRILSSRLDRALKSYWAVAINDSASARNNNKCN